MKNFLKPIEKHIYNNTILQNSNRINCYIFKHPNAEDKKLYITILAFNMYY